MSKLDLPIPFEHDRTRNASAQVFDYLREIIISLVLKPGTLLPRGALADHFKLSLTPIRDALLRLEEEGLVDIFPQHATVVRSIDIAAAKQGHFLRLSLELEVARTLAITPEVAVLGELQALITQQQHALASADYERFAKADQQFHRVMYQSAKMEGLWDLVRRNSGDLDRLRRLHMPTPGKGEAVVQQHAAIAAAIAAGDAPRAQDCVRQHLSGTLANLDDIRARYPSFFLAPPSATASAA